MYCTRKDFTFSVVALFFHFHIHNLIFVFISLFLYAIAQFFCLETSLIYSELIFFPIPPTNLFHLIFHPFFRSLICLLRNIVLSRGFCETLLVICICSSFHCLLFSLIVHARTFLLMPWLFRLI